MKIGYGFLKVDLRLQQIIGGLYLFSGFAGFVIEGVFLIALMLQFVLGAWQVLSGLLFTAFNRDTRRGTYLLAVLAYFILLSFGVMVFNNGNWLREWEELVMAIGLILVPLLIAVWYFSISLGDYNSKSRNLSSTNLAYGEMPEILDSDELGKSF